MVQQEILVNLKLYQENLLINLQKKILHKKEPQDKGLVVLFVLFVAVNMALPLCKFIWKLANKNLHNIYPKDMIFFGETNNKNLRCDNNRRAFPKRIIPSWNKR